MALTDEQRGAVDIAMSGHNLGIYGQAGTGKTYVVECIYKNLVKKGKRVNVTCSTGMATTNYSSLSDAMTVHRWCGIQDGRYSVSELCELVKSNEKFSAAKNRILETDVLIIDEISMLSKQLFEQLEAVCREIRGNDTVFGNMQVIVSGDFWQLSPTPNLMYADDGSFCFESPIFQVAFSHFVVLRKVIRQTDAELISAINETARGEISPKTAAFISSLSRPLNVHQEQKSTKLFANNLGVGKFNRDCILEHPGDLVEFKSKDSGEPKYLQKIRADQILWLKEECEVILMKNISDQLVNGSRGIVKGMTADTVQVHFQKINKLHPVSRMSFTGIKFYLTFKYMQFLSVLINPLCIIYNVGANIV